MAVQPIAGQTKITTDSVGLTAGEVMIPVSDGQMPAYRAMPEKRRDVGFPVILVIHEIFGVHEWIQDVCRRFAKFGCLAIAPALYARIGEVKDLKDPREINRQVFSRIPDSQTMADLDSTVVWAGKTAATRGGSRSRGFAGAAE